MDETDVVHTVPLDRLTASSEFQRPRARRRRRRLQERTPLDVKHGLLHISLPVLTIQTQRIAFTTPRAPNSSSRLSSAHTAAHRREMVALAHPSGPAMSTSAAEGREEKIIKTKRFEQQSDRPVRCIELQ